MQIFMAKCCRRAKSPRVPCSVQYMQLCCAALNLRGHNSYLPKDSAIADRVYLCASLVNAPPICNI